MKNDYFLILKYYMAKLGGLKRIFLMGIRLLKLKTSDFKGVLSDFFSKVMKNYYFCKKNRFMVKV